VICWSRRNDAKIDFVAAFLVSRDLTFLLITARGGPLLYIFGLGLVNSDMNVMTKKCR
jgi:hypothetical protein